MSYFTFTNNGNALSFLGVSYFLTKKIKHRHFSVCHFFLTQTMEMKCHFWVCCILLSQKRQKSVHLQCVVFSWTKSGNAVSFQSLTYFPDIKTWNSAILECFVFSWPEHWKCKVILDFIVFPWPKKINQRHFRVSPDLKSGNAVF